MAGAAAGIVDFIRGFGERKRAADINVQLRNYLTNPDAAIAGVNQIDPRTGIALNAQHESEQAADAARATTGQERNANAFGRVTGFLRAMPEGSDYGAAIDNMAPFLTSQLGATPDQIAGWKQAISANPTIIQALDDKAMEAASRARYGVTTATPGSHVIIGGKVVDRVPFALRPNVMRRGDGGSDLVVTDPNVSGAEGDGPGMVRASAIQTPPVSNLVGAPTSMTVDAVRPHFVAQESHGNYTAQNKDTGALGAYQVMPATGATLARRLGLGWRPDMMVQDTPEARRYQDAIGGAAIQEAVNASGGDPRIAALYYHGGSNRTGWGPKTNAYADEMMKRFGATPGPGDGAPGVAPTGQRTGVVASTPGKPAPAPVRAASPQELAAAGYPEGTAAQIKPDGSFTNIRTLPVRSAGGKPVDPVKLRAQAVEAFSTFNRLEGMARAILNDPALDNISGSIMGALPNLRQGSVDVQGRIEGLRGNIGLAAIAQLKSLSATGATGFGNLSDKEGARLDAMLGNLNNPRMSADAKRGVLRSIVDYARTHKDAIRQSARTIDQPGASTTTATPAADRPRYRNPQTGATVEWNGRGWVPVRGN